MKLLKATTLVLMFLLFVFTVFVAGTSASAAGPSEDFFGYYTRLDYQIPVESALSDIPGQRGLEDEEEEEARPRSGPISDKYADVIKTASAR